MDGGWSVEGKPCIWDKECWDMLYGHWSAGSSLIRRTPVGPVQVAHAAIKQLFIVCFSIDLLNNILQGKIFDICCVQDIFSLFLHQNICYRSIFRVLVKEGYLIIILG